MFRRVYINIASILILSTVTLLSLVGGILYIQLKHQMASDSKQSLSAEMSELVAAVQEEVVLSNHTFETLDWSDELGQNVYFCIVSPTFTLTSKQFPVDAKLLQKYGKTGRFATLTTASGKPYRLLQQDVEMTHILRHPTVHLYVVKLILQEQETLTHVRDLLFLSGAAGIVLSIVFNLWVAKRALTPARRTWEAHRDTMIELSHELQTPLATINALVGAHVSNSEVRQQMLQEIDVASNMVKNVLYLSKLRAMPRSRHTEPVAVSDLTEETAERFIPLAKNRSIKLTGTANFGIYVDTTTERWDRVVSTLFKNIVDHAAPSTTARWSLKSQGGRVRLVLQNEVQTLEPPADDHAKGFGLPIADRLVREMQGTMLWKQEGALITVTVDVPKSK